jgi:hypothetical protein
MRSCSRPLIANIHAALQYVKTASEQFKAAGRRAVLVRYVSNRVAPTLGPLMPPPFFVATNNLGCLQRTGPNCLI